MDVTDYRVGFVALAFLAFVLYCLLIYAYKKAKKMSEFIMKKNLEEEYVEYSIIKREMSL